MCFKSSVSGMFLVIERNFVIVVPCFKIIEIKI